jgi:hypothetical protein
MGNDINCKNATEVYTFAMLNKRISSHKEADKRANRPFNNDDFVDAKWVLNHFDNDPPKCHYEKCQHKLSLDFGNKSNIFSIDRINNTLPHIKSNCVLSCRRCNTARKNAELLQ